MNQSGKEGASIASPIERTLLVVERVKQPSISEQSEGKAEESPQGPMSDDIAKSDYDLYHGGSEWPICVG